MCHGARVKLQNHSHMWSRNSVSWCNNVFLKQKKPICDLIQPYLLWIVKSDKKIHICTKANNVVTNRCYCKSAPTIVSASWVLSFQLTGLSQDDILIVMPFITLLSVSAVLWIGWPFWESSLYSLQQKQASLPCGYTMEDRVDININEDTLTMSGFNG